jgi:hypothetical protein
MSMLGKRIRREWFDRWCDNPARIVPRMEMPAVKIPVRGVLNEKIDDQLASVWHILNIPGFEPPEPNPVRVLRLSGVPEKNERPIVIHDVFKDGDKTYLFPLVIGLPNRHNILFDLETNRLAAWWLGDTARQRTKGKSWYWETGAKSLLDSSVAESEISLIVGGRELRPKPNPQFPARLDRYGLVGLSGEPLDRPRFTGWLTFPDSNEPDEKGEATMQVAFNYGILPLPSPELEKYTGRSLPPGASGFAYGIGYRVRDRHPLDEARLRIVSPQVAAASTWDPATATLKLPGESGLHIRISAALSGRFKWAGDGTISMVPYPPDPAGFRNLNFGLCEFFTTLPVDEYLADAPPVLPVKSANVAIAPGLVGTRLPLADDIMPAAFSWTKDGKLVFATLKGQVLKAIDENGDGDEDTLRLVADGLATPYGINSLSNGDIDVIAKDGLLRLVFLDENDRAGSVATAASGWGMTEDYHDWAVGLVGDDKNGYYVALPCQQDQRSEAAATLRGKMLKLVPRRPQFEDPRLFDVEVISAGHRFPMGMARNRDGELFVTDNQGNYNPFNELNHVRKGAHFGFINALEKEKGYQPPPLTEPAINIPHPWTRSVNGICFLDTPVGWVKDAKHPPTHAESTPKPEPRGSSAAAASTHPTSLYGPFEGHLIGCEYDTRRLIRMSLQKIGDTYQGCAYPLSIPPDDVEKGLLGPIVCAIKPTTGELYVGEIRDSGWGASNNIGQIVKIKIEPDKLPCGIAEVRANSTGFTIDFIQPVDPAKARDLTSYSIQSYRRESTPAYGGPDLDRRDERITSAEVSADGKRVTLKLPGLRARHVYELRTKNLAPGGRMFHPDEAHYTLRQIPQ